MNIEIPSQSAHHNRPSTLFARLTARRHGGVLLFFVVYLAIAMMVRIALLFKSIAEVNIDPSLLGAIGVGLLYDMGSAAFASLPVTIGLTLLPGACFARRWQRWAAGFSGFVILYLLLFGALAEWVFWDEFSTRFNFIAVDYLVYTQEVIGNIRESYPMPLLFAGLFVATILAYSMIWWTRLPSRWLAASAESWSRRWRAGVWWIAAPLAVGLALDSEHLPEFKNNFHRELAKNGLWSLFAAFRANELSYSDFYPTAPGDQAFARLHRLLATDRSQPLGTDPRDPLRQVVHPGPEQHLNVIQITVESLSADFVSYFNHASQLTPNLTALAEKSLVFENFYATGTRTDRGMEALTLSLPPTPGRSIVKRPRNEHLFTLGSVFRTKGYDTAFIYGGFGYFDNMNHFFGENGYRVIDRTRVTSGDITFSNVWGACDEDLFRWTLREADARHASGQPFFFFLMTTSNHRPYTFPDGRIDLPSKISGRAGAVKYTDYAIGKLLRDAAEKPWFTNTVFVIVADHCASVAGKTALPVQNYHIPLFIYSPGGQLPTGRVTTLTSQVDYAPTLLGLLGWSYPSRFFGHDVMHLDPAQGRAFIGNYQKLGLFQGNRLAILAPMRQASLYRYDPATYALMEDSDGSHVLVDDAIAYYQSASILFREQLQSDSMPDARR